MKISHPYCYYVSTITDNNDVDKKYHDTQYGVSIDDDNELFGRLILEINQAGLSWHTILVKEHNFHRAYDAFSIEKVAAYSDKDIDRLMQDAGIIRNRLKIHAAIYNAQQIRAIQKAEGSFKNWIDRNAEVLGQDKVAWVKLFKKHFKFVGGEIVGEFLMSIGILEGAHDMNCPYLRRGA